MSCPKDKGESFLYHISLGSFQISIKQTHFKSCKSHMVLKPILSILLGKIIINNIGVDP